MPTDFNHAIVPLTVCGVVIRANMPVRVSPVSVRFFSARGLEAVASELLRIWSPPAPAFAATWLWRRKAAW